MNQVQVDYCTVCSYHWFNLQSHPGITRLELCRRCRRHHYRDRCRNRQAGYRIDGGRAGAGNLGNLRLRKFRWVTKFPYYLNDGALSAFRGDLGGGKKIDPFSLVESPYHNLKLRIGENAGQPEDARGNAHSAGTAGQQCIECVSADPKGAAPIASGNRAAAGAGAVTVGEGRSSVTNWISIRVQEWKIRRVNSGPCSRTPARSKKFVVADVERAEEPIKAELF